MVRMIAERIGCQCIKAVADIFRLDDAPLHIRFAAHTGLESDIALRPKSANVRRPRRAPRHRHGAGIRKPSQQAT
jgi:hypothetical protein